jgi:hypothetical protein
MFPKVWAEAGLHYPQLLDRLVELALDRHRRRRSRLGRSGNRSATTCNNSEELAMTTRNAR